MAAVVWAACKCRDAVMAAVLVELVTWHATFTILIVLLLKKLRRC